MIVFSVQVPADVLPILAQLIRLAEITRRRLADMNCHAMDLAVLTTTARVRTLFQTVLVGNGIETHIEDGP